MPRYTEDFSPFRALLGAPYPLPIYIARRVYPRQAAGQQYAVQQPGQNALTAPTARPTPPPPGPPPPFPIPPCPPLPPSPVANRRTTPPPDAVAAAAHARGFPYDPNWRERPPATGPIPYPPRTPEQEAQAAARKEIRLELRRYRRIAATAGRVRVNVTDGTRDVVDAMAPVRNMQAVRRMKVGTGSSRCKITCRIEANCAEHAEHPRFRPRPCSALSRHLGTYYTFTRSSSRTNTQHNQLNQHSAWQRLNDPRTPAPPSPPFSSDCSPQTQPVRPRLVLPPR